jgi:D-sedoheptulose 7-phosphate isomerase/D-glycero-D-manno-heptose 1,7-bisphosphate phosphatase
MALAARTALGLDLTASWVVGDSACDVGLARAVGARALHIGARAEPPETTCDTSQDLAPPWTSCWPSSPGHGPTPPPSRSPPSVRRRRELRAPVRARAGAGHVEHRPRGAGTRRRGAHPGVPRDRAVFSCGNGGSASIANHFQCDHVKGVRTGTGLTTRVVSLSTNIEIFSAIANDIGYDAVFEHQLESLARAGRASSRSPRPGGRPTWSVP